MAFFSTVPHRPKHWQRSKNDFKFVLFSGFLILCSLTTIIKGTPSERHGTSSVYNQANYSYPVPSEEESSDGQNAVGDSQNNFRASPSLEDPVFSSRIHSLDHGHHRPQDIHDEYPPGLSPPAVLNNDKGPKSRSDPKALAIDKSPPELQFGLSFTVPFISVSTQRLLSTLSGKGFGDGDPYSDVASLLKLNVGGLVVAAIVGIAALIFVPTLLPGKFPGLFGGGGFPGGFGGFMPGILDQIMPGLGFNKPFGYGQYDHAYDPYSGDYHGSSASYNLNRQEGGDGRGRALKNGQGSNGTIYNQIFSTVQKAVHQYWGDVETCAAHAMCFRGKLATEERQKRIAKHEHGNVARNSRRLEDDELNDESALTSFEHVLEAIQGMKGITKKMPLFHQLHKAFKAGQHGTDCSVEYKQCPVTPDHINKAIQNMGNYIFN